MFDFFLILNYNPYMRKIIFSINLFKEDSMILRRCVCLWIIIGIFCGAGFAASNSSWASPLAISPFPPKIGQSLTFRAALKVSGGPVESLTVAGFLNGKRMFSRTFPRIEAEKTEVVEFTCKVTAGTHTAVFQIDPQQSSSDSNRRDNHLERSFTVEGYQVAKMKKTVQVADLPPQPRCTRVALPDISIDETVFEEPADYYTGNRFVRPGKKIRLRVDLRNLGQCETGVFYIRCLLTIQAHNQTGGIGKTEKSFQKKFGSIPPGQMSSTVFEYNALPDSWSYYSFDIRVDPDDRVEEFSEVMYKETHNFPQYLDGKTVLKEVIREIEAKEK
jgi:hypothetical protein